VAVPLGISGSFSTLVTVPTLPGGIYNVRATDGVNTAAAVLFTITPAITPSPNTGPAGATITVTGAGFAANTPYDIWYDTDGTAGQVGAGDTKLADVTTGPDGTFTASVTIPVGATTDLVMVIGDGQTGAPLASATFTVIPPGISPSPPSGPPGTSVTIAGSGFTPGASGVVWFDTDGDSVVDAGEPSITVTANAAGEFTATLTIPTVAGGSYNIRADVPSGGTVEASAPFTVILPTITLNPTSGPPGTSISVSGANFLAAASGFVWFDTDGDFIVDPGEPSVAVTTDAAGAFTATLTVPTVASGIYNVRADIPSGGAVEAYAPFTVTSVITLSLTSGSPGTSVTVTGSGFAASTIYRVYFDIDGDSVWDSGEPYDDETSTAVGTFTATLTVPTVAAGTYYIRADDTWTSAPAVASATFMVVIPAITVSPTAVAPGQIITVSGTGFTPGASGLVWLDTDGDSAIDLGEPSISVTADAAGAFTTSLTAPDVPAGPYWIRADVPTGSPIEASTQILVVAPGFAAILNAINEIKNMLGTFTGTDTVASLLYAIEGKLDKLPAFGDLVTKNWADLTGYIDGAKSAIIGAVSDVQGKLDKLVVDEDKSGVPDFIEKISSIYTWLTTDANIVDDSELAAAKGEIINAIQGISVKAAQATSGSGSTTFTSSSSVVIYSGSKVGTVTVSIRAPNVGYGERLVIRYYLDGSNYIEKVVTSGRSTTGWTDTAAAMKVELVYTWSSGTDTVYWAYSVIYPPN
jgi:hypothetical protein